RAERRRKSAVELLAASRPQYVKSAAVLDSPGLSATTPDRHFRSICYPREKPPTRSKSEFDVSKLHELLAQDESDGYSEPGDTGERTPLSSGRRTPAQARGEGSGDESGDPHSAAVSGAECESGETKINTAPDSQDESQPFSADTDDNAAAATAPAPPLPPPRSAAPPTPPPKPSLPPKPALPPKPSSLQKPVLPPKPAFLSSGGEKTSAGCDQVYTARPIYINLSNSQSHNTATFGAQTPHSSSSTPLGQTISVISSAHHLVTPGVMSEESSDKTPTNPAGGDMSASQSSSAVIAEQVEVSESTKVVGVVLASSAPSPATPTAVSTSTTGVSASGTGVSASATPTSATSSPGHRASLRTSREYMASCGFSPVPRSFSDIACHHSRAGSDVSSEASRASRNSRTSRGSAGANLEKFFNEMGMEPDILDPMIRMQRRRGGPGGSEQDIYNSVSSLDSHDARSICSALSRSERELSDAESFERNQHQTSIVERNARIIKWLCSVKKAKTPAASVQGSAAS
ncbi:protein FAM110B-like, partial [Littorina saxatilis]|uniref:protein FAM110B-like n=1 Tax=Littorina saxatilis TaxID=31220 RepID=UPI0038B53403